SADVITLQGTSPPTAFFIRAVGQDETSFSWTSTTAWELAGVVLQQGTNSLTIEGVDHEGNVVAQTQFTITKTGNAPPVIALSSSPKSQRIAKQ
ncbi:hypothetical protein N8647_01395, partial [bacterium]|nr:hypothetical protein [bacterium]